MSSFVVIVPHERIDDDDLRRQVKFDINEMVIKKERKNFMRIFIFHSFIEFIYVEFFFFLRKPVSVCVCVCVDLQLINTKSGLMTDYVDDDDGDDDNDGYSVINVVGHFNFITTNTCIIFVVDLTINF